ncbi:MAG: M48 family metalloprotease [Rhodoferax sp.]|nr:M48 family metalloprotease [Rhodoferax sp.]
MAHGLVPRGAKAPGAASWRPVSLALVIALALALAWPQGLVQAQVPARVPADGATSNALPHLGDGTEMSPAAERRLGDSIARSLYRDPDYIDDPVIMEYVQEIWQPLLAAAKARGEMSPELFDTFAWAVLLGRDRSVNAFALPGGYFGVHLGLVGIVSTRDELASVLGHELSHVTQRHIARNMAQQSAQAPWMMGAMILGILAASKSASNGQAANALITGGQAAAVQSQLNFSRDMEREADRIGFGVMTQAGFAPQGFVGMFEKLQQANRLNDSGGFPYLRTHPLTTERVSDMQNRIGALGPALASPKAVNVMAAPDWDPLLVAARARVLSNSGVDALRVWQTEVLPATLAGKTPGQQAAAWYGATLAATKLRDYASAQALCQQLRQLLARQGADGRLGLLLEAELALAQDDGARAAALWSGTAGQPTLSIGRAELALLAQAQLQAAQPQGLAQTVELLRDWVAVHPRDALVWRLLGRAYEVQGRNVAAVRAQAQADGLEQDWSAALSRLRAAQDLVRAGRWGTMGPDPLEAAIVDTRAREVTQLLREQAVQR